MADCDDVPPLEDMSDLLKQVEELKELKKSKESTEVPVPVTSTATINTKVDKQINSTNDTVLRKKKSDTSKNNFGGFKKGFLFGNSGAKPKTNHSKDSSINAKTESSKTDIPFIKPQETKEKQYQMPEVQEAMKATQSLLDNKEWITDDLLKKVEDNETLFKRLEDPSFTQALAEFQTNPQAAMIKYKDNQEIQKFFKEFCGILGDHFSNIGSNTDSPQSQQAPTMPSSSSTVKSTPKIQVLDPSDSAEITESKPGPTAEERRVQELCANPKIREILMAPEIQRLFQALRTNPAEGQRMLQTASTDLKRKIQILMDNGLLALQS